jgi:hypothetical protein
MEAAHSIGGQSVIHRDAPKSLLVYSLFAIRKLLGIATFALIVVLPETISDRVRRLLSA